MAHNAYVTSLVKWGREHVNGIVLFFCACIFFWAYLYLYRGPIVAALPDIAYEGAKAPVFLVLNQPDESANYFFMRALAIEGRAGVPIDLQMLVPQKIHPRSTTVVNDMLVPISFPGFIFLYGSVLSVLARVFPLAWFNMAAVSLTPLLAVLAPLLLYGIVRRMYDRATALAAAALVYIQPAWWYYASRPFQHHIALLFSFLCAMYAVVRACTEEREPRVHRLWWCLAGLAWSLAVYVRPVEIVWMTASLGGIMRICRRAWRVRDAWWFGAGALAGAALFLCTNFIVYGTPFGTGYVAPTDKGAPGTILQSSSAIGGGVIKALTLPFGFHPRVILHNFNVYGAHMPGLWFWAVLAGVLWCIYRAWKKELPPIERAYLYLWFGISAYLFVYYGSWLFFDNLAQRASIGSSYVRYFLPIALFSTPLIARALVALWRQGMWFRFVSIMIAAFLAINAYQIVYTSFEGLFMIKDTVEGYYEARDIFLRELPHNAVIVSRYADKYLFPYFSVMTVWDAPDDWDAIAKLVARKIPVYWYELPLDEAGKAREADFLSARHLRMSQPLFTWDGLELRQIAGE